MKTKRFHFWSDIIALAGALKSHYRLLFLFFVLFFIGANQIAAHGDFHEVIERLDRQIEASPEDVLLHFERGLMHQEHGALNLALADYLEVLRLEPGFHVCHLQMAQLYLERDLPVRAFLHISTYLEKEPGDPFGYQTRALIHQKMGGQLLATEDLRTTISLKQMDALRPEDYLLLSDGLLKAFPEDYDPAVTALKEGVKQLGAVITLQSRLVELLVESGDCSAALEQIDNILKTLPRKTAWLQKKAAILELDGRLQEAEQLQVLIRRQERNVSASHIDIVSPDQSTRPSLYQPVPVYSTADIAIIRGPYLQMGTPNSVVIRWRTDVATESKVWYGSNPDQLDRSAGVSYLIEEHEVMVTGLTADTRYYYAVGDESGVMAGATADHYFKTSPSPGAAKPFRAWILGDCGTGNDDARAVRDGFLTYTGNHPADMILLLGDNAYDDGKDSEYQKAMFENMYEAQLIQSILWPAPGNHDFRRASSADQTGPYFDIFTMPTKGEAGGLASGTEAYYSFDYGNVHFVSLDSHDSGRDPGDPMLVWLENDLNATNQEWTVVFFHHPPYSKGSHDSDKETKLEDMRENVLPVLEAAGVDLVMSGHSHSYERSYLINGHYGRSNTLQPGMILDNGDGRPGGDGVYDKIPDGPNNGLGAVYTVAGSSGKITTGEPLNHPVMYYSAATLGSLSLEVNGSELDLKFVDVNGAVLDFFTIEKSMPVGVPPEVSVTAPADGAAYTGNYNIVLKADASDTDGYIEKVIFLVNDQEVGVDSLAPYIVNWMIPANGDFTVTAVAVDNDGNETTAVPVSISAGQVSVCSRIKSSSDDAEEDEEGVLSLTSSDLELTEDGSDIQTIGMRFTGLNIPQGATIISAYIQFTVDETDKIDPCELVIYGEATDSAATYTKENYDITRRKGTLDSISWSPPEWEAVKDAGAAQRSPDIASIIAEIVNRQGYVSGNAVNMMIKGAGRRVAEAYDGTSSRAAELCIEYLPSPPTYDCPDIQTDIGAPCDDGDPCTTDDAVQADCGCAGEYADSDADGICDAQDDCPGLPAPGAPCDDGDPCTTDDAVQADCGCAGEYADSDADGICDAQDDCPGLPAPGAPCDDGDPCTTDDVVQADCGCAGEYADSDADGICDAQDDCPGLPAPGAPCDDGDPCTTDDVVQADCGCAGEYADSDADGICDAQDDCPGLPAPGAPCDDGDPCTTDDVVQADCGCAGEYADSDADGICDAQDDCPGLPAPGAPCDDGDPCTTDDVVQADCGCAGEYADSDADGICDAQDDCPGLPAPGAPCDDGDPCTTYDVVQADCGCAGEYADSDADGICDAQDDCPGLPAPGAPCDDGNPYSIDDEILEDCRCAGIVLTCSRIQNTSDDAEEKASGKVSLISTDLELIHDGEDQTVGLRFADLNILQGATILSAYLQFTTGAPVNVNPCELLIYGEASDNAEIFAAEDHHITSRVRTLAKVPWAPADWLEAGDAGSAQQTPDISPIIQEIVDRSGYAAGNSMVLIIEGSGRRTAYSYDGDASRAAQLCITYTAGNNGQTDPLSTSAGSPVNKAAVDSTNFVISPVNIFPNPVRDELILGFQSRTAERLEIAILDLTGRVLQISRQAAFPGENQLTVETLSLNSGIYLLQLRMGASRQILKFAVIK